MTVFCLFVCLFVCFCLFVCLFVSIKPENPYFASHGGLFFWLLLCRHTASPIITSGTVTGMKWMYLYVVSVFLMCNVVRKWCVCTLVVDIGIVIICSFFRLSLLFCHVLCCERLLSFCLLRGDEVGFSNSDVRTLPPFCFATWLQLCSHIFERGEVSADFKNMYSPVYSPPHWHRQVLSPPLPRVTRARACRSSTCLSSVRVPRRPSPPRLRLQPTDVDSACSWKVRAYCCQPGRYTKVLQSRAIHYRCCFGRPPVQVEGCWKCGRGWEGQADAVNARKYCGREYVWYLWLQ